MTLSPESEPEFGDLRSLSDPEGPPTYPARDFLCLDCVVPGDCNPQSLLCLWRADRSEPPDEREVQLLSAVDRLSAVRPAHDGAAGYPVTVKDVARLVGVSASTVGARVERAMEAGLLAHESGVGEPRGVALTPLGRQRLAELQDDRPELELHSRQQGYYQLLATLRDLQTVGPVSASLLASGLHRDRRHVAQSLRQLAELALVRYDFGWVKLTDAGRHLLDTLRAYAVNVRLGPRVLIYAPGRYRVQYLSREDGRATVSDAPADREEPRGSADPRGGRRLRPEGPRVGISEELQ